MADDNQPQPGVGQQQQAGGQQQPDIEQPKDHPLEGLEEMEGTEGLEVPKFMQPFLATLPITQPWGGASTRFIHGRCLPQDHLM